MSSLQCVALVKPNLLLAHLLFFIVIRGRKVGNVTMLLSEKKILKEA